MRQNTKISLEGQEAIANFAETDGWTELVAWLDQMVKEGPERGVLRYDLSRGSEGLLIAKAQAEGARKTWQYLLELKDKLKQKQ